ncbi:MAG: FecR family protein [Maribacter litoralis]|uniref:FecR family protein n=1 Tax=Maribacter litoralis TaxID=2059726 RepID=UPI003299B04F
MKDKQRINHLLNKYVKGECDEKEIEEVIAFFGQKENLGKMPSVDEVLSYLEEVPKMNDAVADSIFDEIMASSKQIAFQKTNQPKQQKRIFRYASIAAVFIGIVTMTYFISKNTLFTNTVVIPQDAITLELEDGSIKVLDQQGNEKVTDKFGNVLLQQQGNQLVYEKVETNETLAYNTLTVPYGKRMNIVLSDGTMAHLNAGTSIKYPVHFIKGKDRQVFITGEAYLDVAKDTEHPFIVNANNLNIRVLGTHFNVSAYPEDENTEVVLVEGSVSLYSDGDGHHPEKNILLEPGFKGSFDRIQNSIHKNEVDTNIYTSWIDGKMIFRNMTFENILKKLERNYNVVFINHNTHLAKKVFNANFGKEPIERVLQELKTNYGIKYTINKDSIIIE